MPRAAFIAGVLASSVVAIAACTSRTLPLPPPEVKTVSAPDADGYVTVSGYALETASVGVVNDRTLEGVIASSSKADCEATCPWEARLRAQVGDSLRVWQFFETEGARDVRVPGD